MGEIKRSGVDRRAQSQVDIKALVKLRSEALSLYADLASHRPYTGNELFPAELKHFCEALIDYTASAHFQLYQHLDQQRERRQAVCRVATSVYEAISQTTDLILRFNDRYGSDTAIDQHMNQVEHDLSRLGEVLAERITQEDQIIDALLSDRRGAPRH